MHKLVCVITNNNIDLCLEPYYEENENYYETYLYQTKQQAIEEVKIDNPEMTDDECWELAKDNWYGPNDENGLYEQYNPQAMFDWYEIGGRWGNILLAKTDQNVIKAEHYGQRQEANENEETYTRCAACPLKDVSWRATNNYFALKTGCSLVPCDLFIEDEENWIQDIGEKEFHEAIRRIMKDKAYKNSYIYMVDMHY